MVMRWQAKPAGSSTLARKLSAPPSAGVTLLQRISACASSRQSAVGNRQSLVIFVPIASCLFPNFRPQRLEDVDLLPDLLRQAGGDALDVADRLGDGGLGEPL